MSFPSKYAHEIWDILYEVKIPDALTLDREYIKIFGTYVTGNKQIDESLKTSFTTVKIPIIRILEYYLEGVEIQIPRREDMIAMHKSIERYLQEWKDYITYSINSSDIEKHKKLITGLEKLSKVIYDKATTREVLDNLFIGKQVQFGLMNPLARVEEEKKIENTNKPDYEGISTIIKKKTSKGNSRF